jgi:hypothetical protein
MILFGPHCALVDEYLCVALISILPYPGLPSWAVIGRPLRGWCLVVLALFGYVVGSIHRALRISGDFLVFSLSFARCLLAALLAI